MPIITIIIPVYKVESLLRKCVDSLLCQTLSNIEIILVDDGSPDKCGNICDEYSQKDSRVIVIHKENGGLSSARNAGIDIAKGEYLMFVDSDDYVEPNFCERAYQIIKENNVVCASFGYYEHRSNQVKTLGTANPRKIDAEESIRSLIALDDVIYNLAWNKIYHKNLFSKIRYPEGRLYEDQGTTYKLFDLAGIIYVSDIPLYNYVRREDSITGHSTSIRAFNDRFDLWYERLLFIKQSYPNLRYLAHKQLLEHVQTGFLTLKGVDSKNVIRKFKNYLRENRKEILQMGLNGRFISLFYICYPLFYLRIVTYRIFHK